MVDVGRLEQIGRELLVAIGENPDREGLQETPRRWANWWKEFIEHDPGSLETTFESVEADQMVVVSGLKVWSLCEHHLLPFWSELTIGYVSAQRILGLSKFGRIAQECAHRLQVQERLVQQVADKVSRTVGTDDVAVVAQGQHLCMMMRGVRMPALVTTSVMRGVFRHSGRTREEFLAFLERYRSC
ncbi:MAG: GTP cyclohydrolase I [Alicyclobacillaceae bacterium]|nr:GTP cyclohydrolase I [Alicyclobacillaceae bacterium]